MASYNYGKSNVCAWIRDHFDKDSTIVDMGACDGKWKSLLPEYKNMDAVEVYEPNLQNLWLYREVFHEDAREFKYDWYDLIIFGDIVEHMTPDEARKMLEYARPRCKDMIIAVPFLYEQGAIYGNPYEVHVQDDLTAENFEERYPGFVVLCDPGHNYRYYHKEDTANE
jgi:hypothetical protein